jgi:hypothetical protein
MSDNRKSSEPTVLQFSRSEKSVLNIFDAHVAQPPF